MKNRFEKKAILENREKNGNLLVKENERELIESQDITYHFRMIKQEENFDYKEIGIENEYKERLKQLGKVVKGATLNIKENQRYLGLALIEAKSKLPYGSFGTWCQANGLSKDEISLFNKKIKVAEKYHINYEKIELLSKRVVMAVTKKNPDFEEVELIEIINSDDPGQKLAEKKRRKIENEEKIEEAEIITEEEEKIEEILEIYRKTSITNKEMAKKIIEVIR